MTYLSNLIKSSKKFVEGFNKIGRGKLFGKWGEIYDVSIKNRYIIMTLNIHFVETPIRLLLESVSHFQHYASFHLKQATPINQVTVVFTVIDSYIFVWLTWENIARQLYCIKFHMFSVNNHTHTHQLITITNNLWISTSHENEKTNSSKNSKLNKKMVTHQSVNIFAILKLDRSVCKSTVVIIQE